MIYPSNPFDWFNYVAQDCNSNALIQLVMQADGHINYSQLRQSVQSALIVDPLLSCRFDTTEQTPCWVPISVNLDTICQHIECQNIDAHEAVVQFLSQRIDASKECPIRVCHIANESNDLIVVKVHHAVSDAAGVLHVAKLIAEMYGKLEQDPNFVPLPQTPRRDTSDFFAAYGVTDKAARFNPNLLSPMQSTWGTPVGDLKATQSFACQTLRLNANELQSIRQFARQNSSSLNAVLMLAYHRALAELLHCKEKQIELQFSANLRHYDPKDHSTISNLSNLFNVVLPTGGDFAAAAKTSKSAIEKVLDREYVLQCVLACELMSAKYEDLANYYKADWEQVQVSGLCTPMISNIGKIDNLSLGSTGINDMYVVPPAFVGPSFMLSASTYNDIMTLGVSYQSPSTSKDFVTRLLNTIGTTLRSL